MASSSEARAFVAAARSWQRTHDERFAARMLRSPFSGVPSDVAAAYADLSEREGSLFESINKGRFAAGESARDSLLAFVKLLREERFELPDAKGAAAGAVDFSSLAEPAQPETPEGLRTAGTRFSASQLNAYVECERKWFYRYQCAAVEDKGSSASFYGTAFHGALEEFHREFPRPAQIAPEKLRSKLEGYLNVWLDRFRNRFETPVEHELQRRRALRTARKYIEWLEAESRRAPFTVVGCELPAETVIEGFDFIGYIDRLDRDDVSQTVAVIDYKTGRIAASAAEYRDRVRQFRDFQLPFYYWARTAAGDRVSRLALVPLGDALADVRPVSLEVVAASAGVVRSQSASGVIPLTELENARARMVEICRALTDGRLATFAATSDPAACTYCAYTVACIDRPYAVENRFGR